MQVNFTVTCIRYDANYTTNADHWRGIFTKSLHLRCPCLMSHFLQSGLQEICCFLECHPTCQFRILFLLVLDAVYCASCAQNRQTPMQNNIPVYSYSHSVLFHCFTNTHYHLSQKFRIFVKCEQQSTKIHKFTWSATHTIQHHSENQHTRCQPIVISICNMRLCQCHS